MLILTRRIQEALMIGDDVGEAYLWDCSENPMSFIGAHYNKDKHCVEDESLLEKWCYAWKLKAAKRYDKPISYKHPNGAVIWVNLSNKK